jgi:hypothetical protein
MTKKTPDQIQHTPSAPRVRLHRERLRNAGNVRLEVSIGADVADGVKAIAATRGVPVWRVVEAALSAYVTGSKELSR